jgi:tetratricopeptide (TPR) repeat protein
MPKKVSIKTLLRTEDAFMSTSDRIYNYYLSHTKKIWLTIGAVAAAFLVGLLVKHFHDARLADALDAFHNAAAVADPAQSAESLAKVAEEYSGAPGARQASFALVATYLSEGDFQAALPVLERLTATLAPAEESLRPLVLSTLGSLYEESGQSGQALSAYRSALDLVQKAPITPAGASFQAELLASIGRVSLAQGQTVEAVSAYEELLGLAPDGYRAYAAQVKLSELAAVAPAAPEPAAAAEPAAVADEASEPAAAAEAAPEPGEASEPAAEAPISD